jgi:hypothetical protein
MREWEPIPSRKWNSHPGRHPARMNMTDRDALQLTSARRASEPRPLLPVHSSTNILDRCSWPGSCEHATVPPVLYHDAHFNRGSAGRKAVAVHRQPMSPRKVEEHRRIATCGNDPPGRRLLLEPVLFQIFLSRHTSHAILAIEDVVRSSVGRQDRWRGRSLLKTTSGFPTTPTIAGGRENRPADGLQYHLAASACRGEVLLLLLVHCDGPRS